MRFVNAFTTQAFGESPSLIIVTEYHPNSKTLAQVYLSQPKRFGREIASEEVLLSFLIQIANALNSIHRAKLAARIIDPSKVLLTGKNRVRLNACAVLDAVQFDSHPPLQDMQQEDLVSMGRLILSIGVNTAITNHNINQAMEQFSRHHSQSLTERVYSLINSKYENISAFMVGLESHFAGFFDKAQSEADTLTSHLARELENSRIARLMMKLNFITERPDFTHDRDWAETGNRYPVKLSRDYVFHQVDEQGNPVVDLGHVISCLNKLDAGPDIVSPFECHVSSVHRLGIKL